MPQQGGAAELQASSIPHATSHIMSTPATAKDIRRLEMKIEELNASLTPVIEVDPENWTGGIVKPKPEKRSKTCPIKTDGNSAQNSKPKLGWKHLKA